MMLAHCEQTAAKAGFQKLEMGSTLTGVPLYSQRGYVAKERIAVPLPNKEALPIITFDHDVTVHLNGEDIRALHFPSGHTDGDSIIFFPKSNVVHMGDDFVRYGFPFIDLASGGSVEGMIAAAGLENFSRNRSIGGEREVASAGKLIRFGLSQRSMNQLTATVRH